MADSTCTTPATGGVVAARKLQIRRKACSMDFRAANLTLGSPDLSPMLSDMESPQIKASRDVRCLPFCALGCGPRVSSF